MTEENYAVKCPKCKAAMLLYVQNVREWHAIEVVYDDENWVDLAGIVESIPDDQAYRLECSDRHCGWTGESNADYFKELNKGD